VRDVAQTLAQQRLRGEGGGVALELAVPHQRAEANDSVDDSDGVQPGQRVDVDQVGRCGEPHREQGQQALAPREHLGLGTELGQQRERLVEIGRPVVLERRGLHAAILPCGWRLSVVRLCLTPRVSLQRVATRHTADAPGTLPARREGAGRVVSVGRAVSAVVRRRGPRRTCRAR
jgi:hypothetical protein